MPRPPHFVADVAAVPGAVYSPFADAVTRRRDVFPLHVGDTWLEPLEGLRVEDLRARDFPGLNRYTDTRGVPELVDALVEKIRSQNRLPCEPESVIVTGGATAGLTAAVGACVAPGEEVLILAPFWPLIRGIVQTFRARPVEVPFYDRVDSAEAALEAVRGRISARTVALYVSTPSNPTGIALPESWLVALAELARRENLWLVSDEVYEDLIYRGEHGSIGRFAPERTVTAFSFSKAYGMAGNRTGYLCAPPELAAEILKVSTHTVYCAPAAGQLAGLRALQKGAGWLERARNLYLLFVDVADRLDDRGLPGLLEDCFQDGVLVAPGASSGRDYSTWIRLCFTTCPPEETAEAVRRLARRIRG
jgi:N-succinyldiaminopimelate aminotransferase